MTPISGAISPEGETEARLAEPSMQSDTFPRMRIRRAWELTGCESITIFAKTTRAADTLTPASLPMMGLDNPDLGLWVLLGILGYDDPTKKD